MKTKPKLVKAKIPQKKRRLVFNETELEDIRFALDRMSDVEYYQGNDKVANRLVRLMARFS